MQQRPFTPSALTKTYPLTIPSSAPLFHVCRCRYASFLLIFFSLPSPLPWLLLLTLLLLLSAVASAEQLTPAFLGHSAV